MSGWAETGCGGYQVQKSQFSILLVFQILLWVLGKVSTLRQN